MIKSEIAHPKIVEQDEWLTARKTLLEHEKEYKCPLPFPVPTLMRCCCPY